MERLKEVQQSTRKLSSSMEISKKLLSTRTNALVILVTLTVNLMLVSSLSVGEQESSGLQSAVTKNEGQLESRALSPRIHNSQRSVNKSITSIEVSVNSRESANVSTSQIVGSTTTLVPPILSSTAASGSSAPLNSFGQKPDRSVTDPMVTAASSAVGSLSTPPTSIVSPSDGVSRRTTSAQEGQRSSGKPSKVSKKQIRQNPLKQDQRQDQQQPQVSSKEVRNSTSPVDKIELDQMSSGRSVRFLDNRQLPTAANEEKQQPRNGQQIPDEQVSLFSWLPIPIRVHANPLSMSLNTELVSFYSENCPRSSLSTSIGRYLSIYKNLSWQMRIESSERLASHEMGSRGLRVRVRAWE